MSAILSEVRAGSGPRCDWLQQSRTSHKIGPVLSFPHASSAAALQPNNALWRGFELAHGDNSTKMPVDLLLRGVRLWLWLWLWLWRMSAAASTRTQLKPFSSPHPLLSNCLPSPVTIGAHQTALSDNVRNLGFILDSNLKMRQHVIKVCQIAYYELKCISSIRSYFTEDATQKSGLSFVYCLH